MRNFFSNIFAKSEYFAPDNPTPHRHRQTHTHRHTHTHLLPLGWQMAGQRLGRGRVWLGAGSG